MAEAMKRLGKVDEEIKAGYELLKKYDRTVTFFGSARTSEDDPNYHMATELSRRLATLGYAIISGGGFGIMSASNKGARIAVQQGARMVLYDIPLLAESAHWRKRLQQVIVVDCDTDTQIARVMRRNQLTREAVEGIIASQATRQQRHAIADAVVQNGATTTLEGLRAQVEALARHFHLIIGCKGNAA